MRASSVAIPILLIAALPGVAQQHRRDPLTDPEIDKIRDAAQEPEARLKLYIEFARARLEKLAQDRADPKATDREKLTRDALQDFLDVYDELGTNLDTYPDRGNDLRKALNPAVAH